MTLARIMIVRFMRIHSKFDPQLLAGVTGVVVVVVTAVVVTLVPFAGFVVVVETVDAIVTFLVSAKAFCKT